MVKDMKKVLGLNPCHSLLLETIEQYALLAFFLSEVVCSLNDPLLLKITPKYLYLQSSSIGILPIDQTLGILEIFPEKPKFNVWGRGLAL